MTVSIRTRTIEVFRKVLMQKKSFFFSLEKPSGSLLDLIMISH
jgi:hypothetical protein